jgi:glutathione S-transferase
MERYRVQEWLNFITSELLKTFGPMFRPATSEEFKKTSVPPGHAGRVQEDFCSARPRRKSSRRLLFRPATPEEFKKTSCEYLAQRLDWIHNRFAGKQYLIGDTFTVADAYMFTVLRWSPRVGIDLSKWSNVEAYLDRVAARPKVKEAMQAEGYCSRSVFFSLTPLFAA